VETVPIRRTAEVVRMPRVHVPAGGRKKVANGIAMDMGKDSIDGDFESF